jgi:hypothetical protein
MATTTTNFGWEIPQSTDLVKDGATAIAALGQDIDTAMVDLKGGTTGQVLAKASGTDLDFSWVAQDDSNAIQNAIVDAKGDLISATADDTPARLAVGANDTVLTADSSTATGLKWAAPASGGGMTLLATTTLSGATTTISSINQTYTKLCVFIYGVTNATANGEFRVAANGTTNIASTVSMADNTSIATISNDYTWLSGVGGGLGAIVIDRTNANNFFQLEISNYASTTNYKSLSVNAIFQNPNVPAMRGWWSFGGILTNSAISSLVFSNSGGNLSTGTVEIYGVK